MIILQMKEVPFKTRGFSPLSQLSYFQKDYHSKNTTKNYTGHKWQQMEGKI